MGFFEHSGFRPLVAEGKSYSNRPGFASAAQLELIRPLWMELHHASDLDEAALSGWLLKWFKVSSLRFLTVQAAPKVITALKTWKRRAA